VTASMPSQSEPTGTMPPHLKLWSATVHQSLSWSVFAGSVRIKPAIGSRSRASGRSTQPVKAPRGPAPTVGGLGRACLTGGPPDKLPDRFFDVVADLGRCAPAGVCTFPIRASKMTSSGDRRCRAVHLQVHVACRVVSTIPMLPLVLYFLGARQDDVSSRT